MSELDEVWEQLEPHVTWPKSLALILLWATHPQAVDDLRGRVEGALGGDERQLFVVTPRVLDDLVGAFSQVGPRPRPEVGAVWVELWRGSGTDEWDDAVADGLRSLNERRHVLERELRRPLVLVLPESLRSQFYVLAPDLWTIRSFTAQLPKPRPKRVSRGVAATPSGPPAIFSMGPPSRAEKEWARLVEKAGEGTIDPWDGLAAAQAAMTRGSLTSARQIALQALAVVLGEDPNELRAEPNEDAIAHPHPGVSLRNLSACLDKLGDVEVDAGNSSAARDLFQRSLDIRELLASADPHNARAQRDLFVSLDKLGDVEVNAGNSSAARDLFQRSLDVRELLASADPHSARAQRDLSVCLEKLGNVEVNAGNSSAARDLFQRSLEIRELLASADPHNARARFDLVSVLVRLADLEREDDPAARERHLRAAAELMQTMDQRGQVAGYAERERIRDSLAEQLDA